MAGFEWIRFLIGAVLLLLGLGIFAVEMIGVFRFRYVLNRMHAAAMGDTLGIGFSLVGLIVMNGANLTSLKLFLIVCFLWFSSPTSSHLIARLEVTTDTEKEKHYREVPLKELEAELQDRRRTEAETLERFGANAEQAIADEKVSMEKGMQNTGSVCEDDSDFAGRADAGAMKIQEA